MERGKTIEVTLLSVQCLPQKKGSRPPVCAYAFCRRKGVVTRLCVCLLQKKGRRPPPVRVSSEGVKASGRYLTSRTEGNCEFSNVTSAATRRKPSLGRHCTGGGTTSLTLGRHCTGGRHKTVQKAYAQTGRGYALLIW